jgi:hypothetical protein
MLDAYVHSKIKKMRICNSTYIGTLIFVLSKPHVIKVPTCYLHR